MLHRIAAVVLLTLVLAGCGDDGGGDVTTTPAATPAATTAAQQTPSPTAGGQKRGLRLVEIGEFESPVYATSPPGDTGNRTFVVEQGGVIRIVGQDEPFLDISDQVTAGGEQGLLSVAFAPDWPESGLFYVYFTDAEEQQRIVEYQASSATAADPDSARLVLEMADDESNHNGGLLLFGPDDHLYVGTGDGGGGGDQHGERGNAQDLGSLLGKLLRIDPAGTGDGDYGVPEDNPFVDREGARPEIYSYGLRNPWRFSFDRVNGALTIGDVGQSEIEEIDYVAEGKGAGANFGWRPFEGEAVYTEGEEAPGHVKPVITQTHADGNCSITGGVVVRDSTLADAEGRYVFGDYCKGEIFGATLERGGARDVEPTGLKVEGLSSFGEDNRGRVFVVSNNGPVYRLAAGS